MLNQGGIARVTLCPSCMNFITCVDRAIRGYDALFCETFEESRHGEMRPTTDRDENEPNRKSVIPKEKKLLRELKGLCQNCVRRDICALPRPRTGVWHCEEFEELP